MNASCGGTRIARRQASTRAPRRVTNADALDEAGRLSFNRGSHRLLDGLGNESGEGLYCAGHERTRSGRGQDQPLGGPRKQRSGAADPRLRTLHDLPDHGRLDVQAMGYVAPAVLRDFGASPSDTRPGLRSRQRRRPDRVAPLQHARRQNRAPPVIIGATLWFSILTLATARESVEQLLWLRLSSGLGLGCIVPNAAAPWASAVRSAAA